MKTFENNLSFAKVAMAAIGVELILVIAQFIYVGIYNEYHQGAELVFNTYYMKHVGFFIFLGFGFFAFIGLTYMIMKRVQTDVFYKLLVLFIAGGIVEVIFYTAIQAPFEGPFVYSILEKYVAILFGVVMYEISLPRGTSKSLLQ